MLSFVKSLVFGIRIRERGRETWRAIEKKKKSSKISLRAVILIDYLDVVHFWVNFGRRHICASCCEVESRNLRSASWVSKKLFMKYRSEGYNQGMLVFKVIVYF